MTVSLDELERQVANLGGQMTGVQAAFDAIMLCTIQVGGASISSLKAALNSAMQAHAINPHLSEHELAGASAFLASALNTLTDIEKRLG